MKIRIASNKMIKLLYLSLGLFLLAIGVIGILIPLFPGLVVVIAAGFFIAKSSRRLNKIFQKNKYYQMYFEHDTGE